MELMTKYQYTYFIYPYVIDSNKYSKYMQKLLKNKNCKLRIFEKEKDLHLYQYFFDDIREYLFWTFNLDKKGIRKVVLFDSSKSLVERPIPLNVKNRRKKKWENG